MIKIHCPKQILPSHLSINWGLAERNLVKQPKTGFSGLYKGKIALIAIGDNPKLDLGQCVIAAFAHYRDAKVILENLRNAGLPVGWISLIARDGQHHDWMPGLKVWDHLDEIGWDIAQENQHFRQSFQQGKYLIAVAGSDDAIRCAEAIFHRRIALT